MVYTALTACSRQRMALCNLQVPSRCNWEEVTILSLRPHLGTPCPSTCTTFARIFQTASRTGSRIYCLALVSSGGPSIIQPDDVRKIK